MKIQILTSKNSWFFKNQDKTPIKYKKYLKKNLITSHEKIKKNNITLIISYFKIIPEKFLTYSNFNLVIHEANLPRGRGFSPLFWQLLNGKKNIVFTLFECSKELDEGKFYLKKKFFFKPTLLHNEIKKKQLEYAFDMVDLFIKKYSKNKNIKSYHQKGKPTYYSKIKNSFSEININKSIKSQINKIRTRDNNDFPAFFYYKKRKYIMKLF